MTTYEKKHLLLISALFAFNAKANAVPPLYNFTENNAGSESSSFGNVKITKGLSSTFGDGVCTITFKNTMTVNCETADHSKICKISKDDLLKLPPFDPIKRKEENVFSISLPFSEEERKQSDELYEKLLKTNSCQG